MSAPPPLRPFGLVLHRDGQLRHEGHPIQNRRMRVVLERAVRFLPDAGKYVVQLGRFRGQVDVEECGFFVRSVDLAAGTLALSDGSTEGLEVGSLRPSSLDRDALLCTVKRDVARYGVPARFTRSAQAELLAAVEEEDDGLVLPVGGRRVPIPPL